jgi:glycosyltransferase involved in cell wall biosynthesis
MNLLFIVRSTLFTAKGGDTTQVEETARCLRELDVTVDIKQTNEKIDYSKYDLLHFFNIIRPADILVHIKRSKKPFVVSTILVDYSFYDKQQRGGMVGKIFNLLSADGIEYIKTIYRFIKGKDKLASIDYLWKGQRKSIKEILEKAACVFVQAEEEYWQLVKKYTVLPPFEIIYNGVDTGLFKPNDFIKRQENLVLCVARIEGIKNQYNLIKAISNTEYKLVLIGNAAPNQQDYYQQCKQIAGTNIEFIDHLPQRQLTAYYAAAKIHILPSWFEICGLSSMEAAAMGCHIIITNNGYAKSYFKDDAFYCDPSQPKSIYEAVKTAMAATKNQLQKKISTNYTWKKTAEQTLVVYKKNMAQWSH